MKKSTLILLAFSLSIASLITTSCIHEGCPDPEAMNYDVDAKRDDGSCIYQGDVVIWCDELAAAGLVRSGATVLTYFVDGKRIGSAEANIYWTGPPNCGQSGSMGVTQEWENSRIHTYSYSVVDQTGWEYWGGSRMLSANACTKIHLTWAKRKKK